MVDAGTNRHQGTVTVLFTDLVDSTPLRDRLGDDAADELRRDHDAALRQAITDHGGREVKHLGDGLMATFGAASDAVTAAVAMQSAIDRLAHKSGEALAIRVGVSAGDVQWEGDDCFGTPVVEAKRLCDAADPGVILVSEVVRLLAGTRAGHRYEATGPLELKGLAEPVGAFSVPWERTPALSFALPAPLAVVETVPYVGRDEQRKVLLDAYKAASAGEGRTVLLAGEPGIGKTRLASELARVAHYEGCAVLFGRCDDGLAVPYQPFAEALGGYVATVDSATLAAQLGPWGGDLARLLPQLPSLVPGLAAPAQADPDTERLRIFEAVTALLGTIGDSAPVVLLLDDLHWAAKPTLLLLRHILRAPPARLLVLGTYRDTDLDRTHPLSEVLADMRRVDGVERLALDGLDAQEVSSFIHAAAGTEVDATLDSVVAAIHEETEGNPFFVGQVLRHLVETGVVVQHEGRWTTRASPGSVGIPEGVREVVGRRLGRLDDAANEVLAVASVIGREFDLTILSAVLGDPDGTLDALESAERAHLIHGVTGRPGRWTFNHALVRSTLYEELPTTRRLRLHRDVGRALVGTKGDSDPAVLADLARHFAEAAALGETERAIDFGRRAAASAMASLAFEEAVGHINRVLDVLELVEPAPVPLRAEVMCDLVSAEYGANGLVAVRPVLRQAVEAARAADRPDLIAEAALRSAGTRTWAQPGIVDTELVAILQEALDKLPAGDSRHRAQAIARVSSEFYFDPDQAEHRLVLADEAMAMAERLGDPETIGYVLSSVRWAHWGPDDLEGRMEMDRRLHEHGRREGLPMYEIWGHLWASVDALEGGDLKSYREHRDVVRGMSTQLGDHLTKWQSFTTLAVDDLLAADLASAESHANEALALGQVAMPEAAMQMWGATIYTVRRLQGRISEMAPLVESMVATYPTIPAWRFGLAYLHTETGDLEAARACLLIDGVPVPPTHDANWLIGQGLRAYVAWRLGDREMAAAVHDELLPHRGKVVWAGVPCTVLPTVDAFLGVTAAAAERWDLVEDYLASALRFAEHTAASPYLTAEVKGFAAQVFAGRGGPGDASRARIFAEEAIALADRHGLVILADHAHRTLEQLG